MFLQAVMSENIIVSKSQMSSLKYANPPKDGTMLD
jgi:hypothetical protein